MENISSIKISSPNYQRAAGFNHKLVYDAMPQPACRNLSYIDSRCIGLLNPSSLMEILPKQISNPKTLMQIVEKNPRLKELLQVKGLKISDGDFINFLKFTDEHMKLTASVASKICDGIKIPIDKARIVKAARLHDMGKIFIPADIINKPEYLTTGEKEVMSIHPELGTELLRALKIDPKTLDLIKNHHNFNKNSSLEQQIVSAADVYAALTENRPYKKSMPHKQAISIIEQSNFSQEVIDAIKKL